MSSLANLLEAVMILFVDHWYSFWRKRKNTSTEAVEKIFVMSMRTYC